MEALAMCWLKRDLWKTGIAISGILLLLVLMVWVPASAAGAYTYRGTGTVQATPTEDATLTALDKEKLTQDVAQQQYTLGNWLWSNAAAILSSAFSTLIIVGGAFIAFWRWRGDQKTELEKRAEERFQAAVTGLGDEKEGARIGAAILLRTFLRPGYEQFYTQTFDLAVANLLLPRTSPMPDALHAPPPQADPNAPLPLTTLSQALIVVFKESFPLARRSAGGSDKVGGAVQSLDATDIQLDNAYLSRADLQQIWMPQASLRKADLSVAKLTGAKLTGADLSGANLTVADLSGADLRQASLTEANLYRADLSRADLNEADLSGAKLSGAKLSGAKLTETSLTEASLTEASLTRADLRQADLTGASLTEADLTEASLSRAYLNEADLSGAKLSGADLSRAYLNGADLSGAILSGADLSGAILTGAILTGANLEDALSLKDTDLRGVKGMTKNQLAICEAKGLIISEDPTTSSSQFTVAVPLPSQSDDVPAQSVPPAQVNTPSPDTGGSSAASSEPGSQS
jgi:uncharacterized protein YjbI with pentapeptide repeats